MRCKRAITCGGTLVVCLASVAGAQSSPYVDMTDRAVKALSAEDVAALRSGDGMGYALAAELNHYPGPRHVLELTDSLALAADQRREVEAEYADMRATAQRLGGQLIAAETRLDSLFAHGNASLEQVERAVLDAGRLDAELRFVHLAAHVRIRELLTEHQRATYDRLRGYQAGHDHQHRSR